MALGVVVVAVLFSVLVFVAAVPHYVVIQPRSDESMVTGVINQRLVVQFLVQQTVSNEKTLES